jgi:hypothetical protein
MVARLALAVLALVTGGFQVVDGMHVLVRGRYLGPETPGPWRHVVAAVGLDPFAIGPFFLTLGCCWLAAATALLTSSMAAWWGLLLVAAATLWYLPIGTLTSLVTIVVLIVARRTLVDG